MSTEMINSKYEKRKKVFYLHTAVLALAIAAMIVHHFFPIEVKLSYGQCIFPYFLHIYCPGCGGTRAVNALLEWKPISSFLYHPIPLYLILLFLQAYAFEIYTYLIRRNGKSYVKIWPFQWWGLLVMLIANVVLRNLIMIFTGFDYIGDCGAFWQ